MDWLDLITFFFTLIVFFVFSSKNLSSSQSEQSYLLNDRNTGLFSLIATLVMTELNPATLVSFSSLGYSLGLYALVFPTIFLLGISFYGIVVAKKWKQFDRMSVAEFFCYRYTRLFGQMVSLCLLLSMMGFCATYIKSMSLVFHQSIGLPLIGLAFILSALVLAFTMKGGLVSIIRFDQISFLLSILFFPLLVYFSWQQVGFISPTALLAQFSIPQGREIFPLSLVFSLIFLCMFTYILAPWYGQKIFSAKSEKIAKLAAIISSLFVFLIYSCVIFVSVYVKALSADLISEQALGFALSSLLPKGLIGIGFALFFAAGATTLSGVWSAASAMLVADFLHKDSKRNSWLSQVFMAMFAFLSFILSITLVDRIFDKLILSNIPVLALSFALLGGFYWRQVTTFSASISVIVGLFWGTFCYIYWKEPMYTLYWVFLGIPLIFFAGSIPTFFSAKSYQLQ